MGNFLLFGIVACMGVLAVQAASTIMPSTMMGSTSMPAHQTHHGHQQHSTREPLEHEGFSFTYLPHTQNLVMKVSHQCYVATLTDDEKVAVHSHNGLRQLEVKLVSSLGSAVEVTADLLSKSEVTKCGHNIKHYYTLFKA